MGMIPRIHARKLNRENFEDWPSMKIGRHENFPLYGITQISVGIVATLIVSKIFQIWQFGLQTLQWYLLAIVMHVGRLPNSQTEFPTKIFQLCRQLHTAHDYYAV